ncbi:MAG: 1-acyl-sn-glycerol-3-phosphate acyltransferase [Anaerolineales bacterium]|nr:1-acyl-sn-glycerol-3-phosphate acyltransferase [Anaerolineales bacterium]
MLKSFKFHFVRTVIVSALRLLTSTRLYNLENINQAEGGKAIVAANHLGMLDAAYAFRMVNRKDLIMVVAEKYRKYGFFRWLVKTLNLLWLERFEADFGTLKETLRRLDRGGILFIAPEGTRSKTEALQHAKPGVAYLAAKSGAPVIPVALWGTEDRVVGMNLKRFKRSKIVLNIGKPFTLPPLPRENRAEFLQQQTDEIMAQIAALLPEKYRGVYTSSPRVAELLKENK